MRINRSRPRRRPGTVVTAGLAAAVISVTALACARGSAFEGSPVAYAPANMNEPVVVTRGPGQRALVRPSTMRGERVSNVECVTDPNSAVGTVGYGAYPAAYGTYDRPAVVDAGNPRAVPVRSEIRTVPVYRTTPAGQRVVTERRSGRSWKKTALVIGGSTAAGAGVGALIGGKKGALIGAALGGGASTIYEAAKR